MKKNKTPLLKKRNVMPVTTNGLLQFFIIFFLCCLFIGTVMAFASGGDSWKKILFHNGNYTDLFMDFFNSMRDAGAEDVYTARKNIYPPLCLLFFKLCGFLVPEELIDLPNKRRTLMQLSESSMMVFFLFAVICVLSMSTLINSYVNRLNWENNKKERTYHTVISYMLIVSYPVMYCIERGNIIILSMILTMFFVFFRNSENKWLKELSYIALALAAGIKLYPAIFGIMLLFEKKYKDAAKLVLYGIVAIVVPFVFFMDFNKETLSVPVISAAIQSNKALFAAAGTADSPIINILQNLLSFATKHKSSLNFSSVSVQNFIFFFDRDNTVLAKIVCYITEIIAVLALAFVKKRWQQAFLITYLMLNIPSASSAYALTFMIIPFIMFLYDDKGNGYSYNKRPKIDRIYIFCFSMLLTPLPVFWYYYQNQATKFFNLLGLSYQSKTNQVFATLIFQYLFVQIVVEIFTGAIVKAKKAKNKKKAQKVIVNQNPLPDANN